MAWPLLSRGRGAGGGGGGPGLAKEEGGWARETGDVTELTFQNHHLSRDPTSLPAPAGLQEVHIHY